MRKKVIVFLIMSVCLLSIFAGCDLLRLLGSGDSIPDEKESASEVYLNETLTNKDGIQFRVTKVLNQKSFDNGYGYGIQTDYNFILIAIEIYNGSKTEYYVNPNNFYLLKTGGVRYTYDSRAFRFEDGMTSDYIQPQLKGRFHLLFETPTKSTEEEYNLSCDAGFFDAFDKNYTKVMYLRQRPAEVSEEVK